MSKQKSANAPIENEETAIMNRMNDAIYAMDDMIKNCKMMYDFIMHHRTVTQQRLDEMQQKDQTHE